jgi:hypothetical protein
MLFGPWPGGVVRQADLRKAQISGAIAPMAHSGAAFPLRRLLHHADDDRENHSEHEQPPVMASASRVVLPFGELRCGRNRRIGVNSVDFWRLPSKAAA